MSKASQPQGSLIPVGQGAWLDGELALVHPDESWMAVADLHYGYEICQRAAGGLFPLWGMEDLETRLGKLLRRHRPQTLIIAGDIVHATAAIAPAHAFLARLRGRVDELVLIEGNHDRWLAVEMELHREWKSGHWRFRHGHLPDFEEWTGITLEGHAHPNAMLGDGAGTRLRLPVFAQRGSRWIMPAFSSWAAGVRWDAEPEDQVWLCHPRRVLRLPDKSESLPRG